MRRRRAEHFHQLRWHTAGLPRRGHVPQAPGDGVKRARRGRRHIHRLSAPAVRIMHLIPGDHRFGRAIIKDRARRFVRDILRIANQLGVGQVFGLDLTVRVEDDQAKPDLPELWSLPVCLGTRGTL